MNNVELIGRLTKDPILTKGGVAMFTLAVDRHDKDNGTDYPQIKVFGKQAENVCKYLRKGSQCAVDHGRIETGSYENKSGETVYYTDVVAGRVEFIGNGIKHAETGEKPPANEPEQVDSFEALDEDVPF